MTKLLLNHNGYYNHKYQVAMANRLIKRLNDAGEDKLAMDVIGALAWMI